MPLNAEPWTRRLDCGTNSKLTVEVSTCNQANFNTIIFIFNGTCGNLACRRVDNNSAGCDSSTRLVKYLQPQDNYWYILVNGYDGDTGTFTLTVSVTTYSTPPPVSGGRKD